MDAHQTWQEPQEEREEKMKFPTIFLLTIVIISIVAFSAVYDSRMILENVLMGDAVEDLNGNGRSDMGDVLLFVKETENLSGTENATENMTIELPPRIVDFDVSLIMKNGNAVVNAGSYGRYVVTVKNGHITSVMRGSNSRCNYEVYVNDKFIFNYLKNKNISLEDAIKNGLLSNNIRISGCGVAEKVKAFAGRIIISTGRLLSKVGILR